MTISYLRVLNVGKWSSNVEGSYCTGWVNSAPSILHFSAFIEYSGLSECSEDSDLSEGIVSVVNAVNSCSEGSV